MLIFFLFCIDKKMEKYDVNENEILEELSEVTAAKREASMVSTLYRVLWRKSLTLLK